MSFPYTKEEFVELWLRLMPRNYTAPIEDETGGLGMDVPYMQAAIFARASEAINRNQQAYYLKPHSSQTGDPASGGIKAVGEVSLERGPPLVGDLTIPAGTEVLAVQRTAAGDETEGPTFALLTDVLLPAGSTAPVVGAIEAIREGYHGNLPANRISRFVTRGSALVEGASVIGPNEIEDTGTPDRFVESMVGQYVEFVTGGNASILRRRILTVTRGTTSVISVDGPALISPDIANVRVLDFSELGLTISQAAPVLGGKNAYLDAIGRDRNVNRVAFEEDEPYRSRICEIADTVSPGAGIRAASRILSPVGIRWRIKETRDPNGLRGFVYDLDPYDVGSASDGRVYLSAGCGDVRFFVVCVSAPDSIEYGAPYDATNPPTPNAWDVMPFDAPAVPPIEYTSALLALNAELDALRAGGVCYSIELDRSL